MNLSILKRPFISTEILFAVFLVIFTVLFGPVFGPIARLVGFAAIGIFGLEMFYRGRVVDFIRTVSPAWPYVFFYVIIPVLVLPLFPYFPRVWNNFTGFVAFLIVFYLMRKYREVKFIDLSYIVIVFGIGIFFLVLSGLIGLDTSVDRLHLSASALGTLGTSERGLNASNISLLVGLASFIAAKYIALNPLGKRQFTRLRSLSWCYAGAILLGAYLIIFYSGSRQGFVWVFFVMVFLFVVFAKRNLFLGIVVGCVGGLAFLLVSLFALRETMVVQRILILFDQRMLALEGEKSFFTRGEMYARAFEMWMDSPLWGNGNEAFRAFSGFYTYSHSNYSEIFVCYGLLGALFFYVPIFMLVTVSLKRIMLGNPFWRGHYLWILIVCVAILVSNIFIPSYYQKCMVFFLGYLFAHYYNIREDENLMATDRFRGRGRIPRM